MQPEPPQLIRHISLRHSHHQHYLLHSLYSIALKLLQLTVVLVKIIRLLHQIFLPQVPQVLAGVVLVGLLLPGYRLLIIILSAHQLSP